MADSYTGQFLREVLAKAVEAVPAKSARPKKAAASKSTARRKAASVG